jgi:hypothetical protein
LNHNHYYSCEIWKFFIHSIVLSFLHLIESFQQHAELGLVGKHHLLLLVVVFMSRGLEQGWWRVVVDDWWWWWWWWMIGGGGGGG